MVCLFSRADLAQGETRDASADVSVNHLACGKPGESAGECWVAALARRLQGRTSPLGPISMASPNICRHTFPQGMGDLEWKGPKGRAVLDAVVSNRRSGEKDRLDGNINWKICEILLSLCYTFSTWAMLPVAKSSTLAIVATSATSIWQGQKHMWWLLPSSCLMLSTCCDWQRLWCRDNMSMSPFKQLISSSCLWK